MVDNIVRQAVSLAKSGNKTEARKLATQAVRADPNNVGAGVSLGSGVSVAARVIVAGGGFVSVAACGVNVTARAIPPSVVGSAVSAPSVAAGDGGIGVGCPIEGKPGIAPQPDSAITAATQASGTTMRGRLIKDGLSMK